MLVLRMGINAKSYRRTHKVRERLLLYVTSSLQQPQFLDYARVCNCDLLLKCEHSRNGTVVVVKIYILDVATESQCSFQRCEKSFMIKIQNVLCAMMRCCNGVVGFNAYKAI